MSGNSKYTRQTTCCSSLVCRNYTLSCAVCLLWLMMIPCSAASFDFACQKRVPFILNVRGGSQPSSSSNSNKNDDNEDLASLSTECSVPAARAARSKSKVATTQRTGEDTEAETTTTTTTTSIETDDNTNLAGDESKPAAKSMDIKSLQENKTNEETVDESSQKIDLPGTPSNAAIYTNEGDETSSSDHYDDDEVEQSEPVIRDASPVTSTVTVLETTTTTLLTTTDEEEVEEEDATPMPAAASVSPSSSFTAAATAGSFSPEAIRANASQLRTLGKELHDLADYSRAAAQFGAAANLLLPLLSMKAKEEGESATMSPLDDTENDQYEALLEEFATCRLHEALCRLKSNEYGLAIEACTLVLDWNHPGSHSDSDDDGLIAFTPADVAPALRARAFHRRAKAYMELGQADKALVDARSAAFLGDRKAVALYGKLMRSNNGGGNVSGNSMAGLSALGDLFGSPTTSDDSSSSLSSTGALLESLMSASSALLSTSPGTQQSPSSPGSFFPSRLLDMGKAAPGGQGAGSLAKSVIASLAKRLEDKDIQTTICNYLQSASGPQLQQMASLAGVSLPSSQAKQIASFCNRATPKTIQRTIGFTKRGIYTVQLIRKLNKLVQKYRNVIILLFILAWVKSAVLRPIPLSKKALKAAAKAAAAAPGVFLR